MTRSLDVLKDIYKPLKYTIKGKTTILETTSGNFVVKEKSNDLKELYKYLQSRSFDYFPKLIDSSRKDVNVFEYVSGADMPSEQRAEDLVDLVSLLHNKTSYFKEVSEDKYQEIYENVLGNINHLNEYYNSIYEIYFLEEFLSPDKYLLMRNIYKIFASLGFCESELNNWYDLVKEEKKQRVSIVHNNLETNHFIKGDKDYLISWDNAKVDTPILDLINFYKKEYFNYDFSVLLKSYLTKYSLSEAELKLFFIIISIPPKIELSDDVFENCKNIRYDLDYVFKTEELVRPYYSKQEEE